MSCFEHRMNFEQERITGERAQAFDNRISELMVLAGGEPTIDKYMAAMKQAHEEMDPANGELIYEIDDNVLTDGST